MFKLLMEAEAIDFCQVDADPLGGLKAWHARRSVQLGILSYLILAAVTVGEVEAQRRRSPAYGFRAIEIAPFVGYQVGGQAGSFQGRLDIRGGLAYGIAFDIRVRPDATIELVYNRQETDLDIQDNRPLIPERSRIGLAVEYFHFGGTVEFGQKRMRPYFAMTIGASRFDPKVEQAGDEWRFSVAFGGGFKYYVSDRLALRVDARVYPTFLSTNGGFFCSLPGGCLVSITGDFLVQANATAGLAFAF